jgi:catechol 2,3-dioxygenase-like lactoylglutathione lyase family enzyme
MSRVQLALNVDDIDVATAFYSKLFGVEPAKTKPGYANFVVAEPPLKLVLIENPGAGAGLNHLGVEVESTEDMAAHQARLAEAGLAPRDDSGICCFADQSKVWVDGVPGTQDWEFYTVLADAESFRAEPDGCCGNASDTTDAEAGAASPAPACC